MRTIELGVTITDAAVDERQTTILCTPVARDPRCPDSGGEGRYRNTVTRPLTNLPVVGYPLVLQMAVPRYRCTTAECGRTAFNQTTTTTPPDVPLPPGAHLGDIWEVWRGDADLTYRVIMGLNRGVTDSDVIAWTSLHSILGGRIDTKNEIELASRAYVEGNLGKRNSDQAGKLASALVEAGAEADGWATR